MRALLALGLLGLTGCFWDGPTGGVPGVYDPAEPSAVDEACPVAAPAGDAAASDLQVAGATRLNCHRTLAGLGPVAFVPALNAAAQSHADYMVATDDFGHVQQQTDHPAFTGHRVPERAAAAGFDLDPAEDVISEVVSYFSDGADPGGAIDVWMSNVYHREPLVAPGVDRVGFGSAGRFDVAVTVGPWEGGVRAASYPAAGQWGVPTAFDSDTEAPDPAPDRGVVGYPVSLTFVAPLVSASEIYLLDADPDLTRLVGPDGAVVPADLLTPENDAALLRSVFLLPHEPLLTDSEYSVRFVGWVSGQAFDRSWSFQTGG